MPDERDDWMGAGGRRAVLLALLESAANEARCPGLLPEVRAFASDPASASPARRDHLLDCAACSLILLAEQGCREAGKEAVERSLRRTLAAPELPLLDRDPMAGSGGMALGRPPLFDCVMGNPPSHESRFWDEIVRFVCRKARGQAVMAVPPGVGRARLADALFDRFDGKRWLWVTETPLQARAYAGHLRRPIDTSSLDRLPRPGRTYDFILLDAPFPERARDRWIVDWPARRIVFSAVGFRVLRDWELAPFPHWEPVDTGCRLRTSIRKGFDYPAGTLSALNDYHRNRLIVERLLSDRPRAAIVFTGGPAHSRALQAELERRSSGLGVAVVRPNTSYEERVALGRRLASGSVSVVLDSEPRLDAPAAPEVEAVYLARPTLRPDLYARMCWRALPALARSRPVTIVDFRDRWIGTRRRAVEAADVGLATR